MDWKQVFGSRVRVATHLVVYAGVAAGVHAATPTDNPVAAYGQDWTEALP